MKRLFLSVLLLAVLVATPAFATNLLPLGEDFETFMEALGREMLPPLQQASTMGDALGDADRINYGRFFFGFSTGAVFTDGLQDGLQEGEYEVLDMPALLDSAFGELPSSMSNFYDTLFPYPVLRVSGGVILGTTQLSLLLSGVPGALTGAAADNFEFSALNVGLRARTFLVEDRGSLPAIAVGGGYSLSTLGIAWVVDEFSQDFSGSTLSMSGDLRLSSMINTVGLDLYASKKFGPLSPFVRLSPYLQRSRFAGDVEDFDAQLGADEYQAQGGDDPSSEVISYDFAVMVSGGLDIVLGRGALFLHGNYGAASRSFGAEIGFRAGF
jgi:hypothetical protein